MGRGPILLVDLEARKNEGLILLTAKLQSRDDNSYMMSLISNTTSLGRTLYVFEAIKTKGKQLRSI